MSEQQQTQAPAAVPDPLLVAVKSALNIGGDYQDAALTEYINEVKAFLHGAGVSDAQITPGLVTRGVADLWAYGSGDGTLSEYFLQRAIQAALHS